MKILVTGGTGFIGSNLVIELLRQGHEVLATGNDAEQKIPGFHGEYIRGDLSGIDWNRIGKIDAVFHEAAINDTTLLDEGKMFGANVEAAKKLFEYAARNGCRNIVYASSTAVYGDAPAPYREGTTQLNPLNPYGRSKQLLEEFAAQFVKEHPGIVVVGLRYCNVYGPRENHKGKRASMVYQLARQMKTGNPKIFKHGEQKRDYIYVRDAVHANLLAITATESGIYNCGGGAATSFNNVIKILNETMGVSRVPEYIENPYADRYQSYTECDMALAKEKLGFVPEFDVAKGIADYFRSGFLAS